MAEIISQHQQSSFTDPQNGQSPIDADQVRANDNALRTAYNAHDADTGIHVQSSAIGSRPSAATTGRKWVTVDGSAVRVWYDTGSTWAEVDYLNQTQGGTVAGATTFTQEITASGGVAGDVTGNVTGDVTGNADTATALATGRNIAIAGDVTATGVAFDGTANISLTAAITAGAIVNADINASAAIADTKLATISTSGKVANSATTADAANTTSAIVARDSSGNFAAAQVTVTKLVHSGTTISLRGVDYVLPAADGNSGDILSTDGAGTLSWQPDAGGGGSVSGSGTTGTLPKWTGGSALGNSIIVEASGMIRVGTNPGQSGVLGLPNNSAITARNAANSADVALISLNGSNFVVVGASSSTIVAAQSGLLSTGAITMSVNQFTINGLQYAFPGSHGSSGYVLTNNGSGTLSWSAIPGGVSGLTTGTLPKASGATTLTDSVITESGGNISVSGNVNTAGVFQKSGTQVVGARVTGFAKMTNATSLKDVSGYDMVNEIDSAADLGTLTGGVRGLARFVNAMYDALAAHGLMGA